MTTLNHALWGATIGRTVGMPVEGAIAGSLADLLSIPLLGYYYFQGKKQSSQVPTWAFDWYAMLHNWLIAGVLMILLFVIHPTYLLLGVAYFWHLVEDAVFHTDYATRFLYPLSNFKLQFYSASEHKWVQIVDLGMIAVANILISLYSLQIHF